MLRTNIRKPIWALMVALVWVAAMLGYTVAQEVPVGHIKGHVISTKTGSPIVGARVRLMQGDSDEMDPLIVQSTRTRSDGSYRFSDIPAGNYTIEAHGQVHRLPPSQIAVREGHLEEMNLELAPDQPYLRLYISQRMYMTMESPEFLLDGFTEGGEVNLILHRIDTDKLLSGEATSVREVLTDEWAPVNSKMLAGNPAVAATETMRIAINKRDSEGVYQQRVSLQPHKPGIYVITAEVDNFEQTGWISVSDISLITKESGVDLLTYVVHPDSGRPVKGANITILEGRNITDNGMTDEQGLMLKKLKVPSGGSDHRLIVARKGDSAAFLTSYAYEPASSTVSIYSYTDRPVYRPGQKVHFKGIVRRFVNDGYQTPQEGGVRVEARDRRESVVYAQTLPVGKFGTVHGSFDLPKYAPTGEYSVNCTYEGHTDSSSFSVAEYRKPEFTVSVEMPKKQCVRGEKIKAKIQAAYYFGAPVAGAQVHYSISRADYWHWDDEEDYGYYGGDWDYHDYGGYGEPVAEGTAKTGANGTAEIEFSANWDKSDDEYAPQDQEFTVYAYITDASRRSAEGQGSIISTQGEFDLKIESEQYFVDTRNTAHFRILATDYNKRPRRYVEVEVVASRVSWKAREQRFMQVSSTKVKTDAKGGAHFSFVTGEPGSYVVRAVCNDRKGNRIRRAGWIWVSGHGNFSGYKYPDLEVVLDKKVYNAGDTARVLINSSEQGAMALLTVEGRRLFDHQFVHLTSKSTVVEIPVTNAYKPNFYVSICYVKNKKFFNQEVRAKVSLDEQTVKLTVTPDKQKYEPGDTASYLIKAVDDKGRPVSAEISLGVVDEAIYAIRKDHTTPIRDYFYARQWNRVNTRFSFPEIYLSGDKAGFTGKVRKEFVDTAHWRSDVVTDSRGEARVSFQMPDNLTTWRATARACTMDTGVGQCTSTAICTKNLLVRLDTPRFLVQKDEAVISAVVHNYLPDEQKVQVTLRGPGLTIKGQNSQTVKVASSGVQRVQWRVSSPKVGQAVMTAYASCPAANDAMQLTIPVRPHGQRQVEVRSGEVSGGKKGERLIVRADSVEGASEIRIRVAPSLASAMLGSLEYLAKYPYGCTEQTMSCFLPDVVIWRALKQLNVPNPDLERRLPDMVGTGLNRLYDHQNQDGGWGWCQYGQMDVWMTSYVVYGLLTARAAGFQVNDEVLQRGVWAMLRQLEATNTSLGNRVYSLYVLSMSGNVEVVRKYLEPTLRNNFDNTRDLALLAMTLDNIGESERARTYASRLWDAASEDGSHVKWNGLDDEQFDAPVETTAYALMAALKLTPDDERIPKALRWILSVRKLNHWDSTRDTAMILYVMSEYLARSEELQPDFAVSLTHNGRTVETLRFDKSSLFQPEKEFTINSNEIGTGDNTIELTAQGRGVLYYTVELTQYVEVNQNPKARNAAGITVTREYRKFISRWNERSGTARNAVSKSSSTTFRTGDIVRVRLVVDSPRTYERVIVEDYLPAGCEPLDRGRMDPWEWMYWWVDRDVRDERVTFYVERLPKGRSELEYEFRAGVPGTYHAMPALVQAMYQPEVFASGVEHRVTVNE
jgi:alpha-2-macroglobulin